MSRKPNIPNSEDFIERRVSGERRQNGDRRSKEERRHDFREGAGEKRKNIRIWLRSITKARLGVDRRKEERRTNNDRRQQSMKCILTQDELSELLAP